MPQSTGLIKRRIKSVSNTKKITKAMELVSVAKMKKAVARVLASRSYSDLAWEIAQEFSAGVEQDKHPLLAKREPMKKILLLLITSDRGLCGGFNAQIIREVGKYLKIESETTIDVVACGKFGKRAVAKVKKNVIAFFQDLANNPIYEDILPVGRLIVDEYKKENYDKVMLAFTDYVSTIEQIPRVVQLLPLVKTAGLGEVAGGDQAADAEQSHGIEYKFEPNMSKVLDMLLPRLIETKVYQAILESVASEHSARMMAMKNASDAADDMLEDLTFTFNQIRQTNITREISEIAGGKAVLEQT